MTYRLVSALTRCFVFLCLLVHGVLGFGGDLGCGARSPSQDAVRIISDIVKADRTSSSRLFLNTGPQPSTVNVQVIPVYFHVVSEGSTVLNGDILPWAINEQIRVLNETYEGAGVQFNLAGLDRTVNAAWYHKAYPGNAENEEMMRALKKGGVGDLNIYSVALDQTPDNPSILEPHLVGYATFPWDYAESPATDGVVLSNTVLPGSLFVGHNTGKVGTHEVGHWLGLLHPFEAPEGVSGCEDGAGDDVDDTPAENGPGRFCPIGRDSCPGGGYDPIHNYMDYTDDYCRFEFTPGQIRRLRTLTSHYRGVQFV